ncbi:MAG: glycosyltransferase family 39 protein [Myxococcales bacterium]|nr:glycosyltransferase family 39 protein [Myxococcales bacterium]
MPTEKTHHNGESVTPERVSDLTGDDPVNPGLSPDTSIPIASDQFDSWSLMRRSPHRNWWHFGVLLGLLLLYIPNAGSFGLWDPWETHYGEVTRNMIETADWVSPWWGFREKIGTESVAGSPFFSKPVLIFWIEAVFIKIFGYNEWSFRLPVALIALLAAFSLYYMISRVHGERLGAFAALVVSTSPQFFFLGRQTQTDMPFVGLMTVGLALFFLAVFGRKERFSAKKFSLFIGTALGIVLFVTGPQYGIIATDLKTEHTLASIGSAKELWLFVQRNGVYHVIVYSLVLLGVITSIVVPLVRSARRGELTDECKDMWVRRAFLWAAYTFWGLATLAKGLLGFMLPGAILFLYLLLSSNWKLLKKVELLRGTLIFVCVSFPWYVAMFAKHGMPYYTRFFVHDHFNRIGEGVHQIDSGTFEHFIKWLAYGMFPWSIFVPFVFVAFAGFRIRRQNADSQRKLFLFLWFFVSFMLFTLSSTKFHHYIFPALPPLAVLTALFLNDLIRDRVSLGRIVAVIALGLVAVFTWDLLSDPQHLRNLFTYKYDRPLPQFLPVDVDGPISASSTLTWADSIFYEYTNPFILNLLTSRFFQYDTVIYAVGVLALLGTVLLISGRAKQWALGFVSVSAISLTFYCLNVYMPMLSVHWSQKYAFESYYRSCNLVEQQAPIKEAYTPLLARIGFSGLVESAGSRGKRVCDEDIVSWLITWRGETLYSYNELYPINKEATQFEAYLRDFNKGRAFYVLMERGKDSGWKAKLNSTYLKKLKTDENFKDIEKFDVENIHDENDYFIILKATPVKKS